MDFFLSKNHGLLNEKNKDFSLGLPTKTVAVFKKRIRKRITKSLKMFRFFFKKNHFYKNLDKI